MSRKCLTLIEQYAIVMEVDRNPHVNKTDLAKRYDISRPSINSMLKRKKTIVEQFQSGNFKITAKRMKRHRFEDVDEDLLNWYRQAVKSDKPESITGNLLLKKARELALERGHTTEVTIDWLNRWKRRHDIRAAKAISEADSVPPLQMTAWKILTLPSLLSRYALKDVYNANETALYWKALPDSTHKCHDGEWSKERVTILVGSNADGSEKLPLLMIGKHQSPRSLQGKPTPFQYTSNRNAWMTSTIFENWLRALDQKLGAENRQVALLMDNCPSHPLLLDLTNIEIFLLPQKNTFYSQPMDAGVIKMLKKEYKKKLIIRRLACYERNEVFSVDLFQSMLWLKDAWKDIPPEKIMTCFCPIGFEPQDDPETAASASTAQDQIGVEATDKTLLSLWYRLAAANLLLANSSLEDFLDLDSNIITGDNSISPNVLKSDDSEDQETDDEQMKAVAASECLKALETVRRFFFASATQGESSALIDRLEAQVLCEGT